MAKPKPKVYEVTVAGEYFANVKGGTELKPYEVKVKMSDKHEKEGFLSVFKNLVAPQVMRKKYPDYGDHLATHRIVAVVDLANPDAIPKNPMLMTLPQVIAFIEKNELPVVIALYKDEDELKQAVVECLEDEDSFIEGQDKRKDLRGANIELANELAELNPGMSSSVVPTQAAADAKGVDLTQVPDAEDIELAPKSKPNAGTDDDKVTIDISQGKNEKLGDDDFDI